ncbi:Cys-tRNA(Pro) deacylase [Endozoicomonas sp. SM1973]|uniref:Cys-tRNA(Pro)/Cys-tRNA(Cys) deacylase n=1 Tax=Spartinivicinus marinus TaxID=2994442 RepID=A0A853IDY4_9GAMM|nr:Cys-tRNA(Pro) deacylase [Spartinivicinus marinus]MCX4024807.1 Cys-tRNA(Pro) deacylase [Spartinivicinus marinus]NYZ68758.1 Cys-tRNA(Pro) deacylase [Spartinivicinus marinus]
MTPAVMVAKKAKIDFFLHEYSHDPTAVSYGMEAAETLGLEADRVYKTLLVQLSGSKESLVVALVPVNSQLNTKAVANYFKAKKAVMAEPIIAERTTGYLVGGISPLGQKKVLPLLLDESAMACKSIFISGGKRGLEIELDPNDLLALTRGKIAAIKKSG